jgi:hypothetical protein
MISSLCSAVVPELVENLRGEYAVSGASCAFESVSIKTRRDQGVDYMLLAMRDKQGRVQFHSVDLDNLWTRVKTTRGTQRIMKQERLRASSLIAEEKTCSLGWVNCSDWKLKAEVTLVNANAITASLNGSEPCSFVRSND